MKKITLSLLSCSSLLFCATNEQLQSNISDTEAQIKKLNESLLHLKDELKAQNKPVVVVKKKSEFITHTSLGYIQTSGNTKTKTFNIDASIKKNWDKHVLSLLFDGQYADDSGVETKNKFFTELEYSYDFTNTLSLSYLLGYKNDKFSGFNYQAYTGPGLKYKAIAAKKHKLSVEGSVLYSVDEIEDTSVSLNDGYTDSYASFRAKGVYNWQMLDNLKFDQELTYRTSLEEMSKYFIFSKTMFSSKINDVFSAGVSYKIDYINKAAVGKTSTDKTFTLNLIADY